ncbi:MAG: hypothetical protein KDA20_06595 [Phycisphaerales bacterium]|nr:hypothetical protein [Phycisphaerales bacterium]
MIFDPANREIGWPPPPDERHVVYVGQLSSDRDLKPGQSFASSLGTMLFGRDAEQMMVHPMGVCTDASARLFVADSGARVVHVFDLEDRSYARWSPGGEMGSFVLPVAVAVTTDGRVLVCDAGRGAVDAFAAHGEYLGALAAGAFQRPSGIAVDADRIVVADPGAQQVVVLSLAGEVVERIGSRGSGAGQFNYPTGVAIGGDGALYVSDSLNFRVQVFDTAYAFVRAIGSKGDLPGYFAQPKGVAVDPDEHLYVVDGHFEAVQLFDALGRVLMSFGEEGRGPGQFWLPVGIHIDSSGRIWVADSYNRRVQVFDYVREGSP